ncbi:hypothetical protein MAM1_0315d09575 [Mucor ambiguus]|uniref:Uncharacterized protein n=1 Tax=Mucor ambiguus TaxID=91626 RepID=A0A0C9MH09_9FUNG|nr:hypothetical protein MAM1_0315d09575 [Mucor ambiguus]
MNVQKIGVARLEANGTINLNDVHYDVVMDRLQESPKFKLLLPLYILQALRNTPNLQQIPNVQIDMDNADEVDLGRVIITIQRLLIANQLMDERSEATCEIQTVGIDDRRRRRPGVIQQNETLRLNPRVELVVTMEMLRVAELLDNVTALPKIVPLIEVPAEPEVEREPGNDMSD